MTPSQRYAGRTNAGEVVTTFGAGVVQQLADRVPKTIEISQFDANSSLSKPYRYMFQKLTDKVFGKCVELRFYD